LINSVVNCVLAQGVWCFWNPFTRAVDVAVSDSRGLAAHALVEDLKLAQASL
tara:strand:- start:117 stop:272 length:156 start_codon:yes stop_codon:yes gene_type:complete